MIKIKFFFVFLALVLNFSFVFAEEKLSLGGSWSYQFLNDNRECHVRGGEVLNRTDKSQNFKLVLVLSLIETTGTPDQLSLVYVVGTQWYNSLDSGWQYNDCDFTCNDFKYAQPISGTYYVTLVLLRQETGGYVLDDYLCFKNPIKFENLIMKKVTQLKKDLNEAKIKEKSYERLNNYYPENFENRMAAREWSDRKSEIQRKLIDLGYDREGLVSLQSGNANGAYSTTKSVPDYVLGSSYSSSSSSYVPSYSPSYSSPSSSGSSSSSSNSGSGMHQEWVKCTSCNGTGKNSSPTNYAPRYEKNPSKPWCDICKKYDYRHTHDYCHLCNGKGSWQKWVKD